MAYPATDLELPDGVNELLASVAESLSFYPLPGAVEQHTLVMVPKRTLPESLANDRTLQSAAPSTSPPSFAVSTGADISPDRVGQRRGSVPEGAVASAFFVSALGLVVGAAGALVVLVDFM